MDAVLPARRAVRPPLLRGVPAPVRPALEAAASAVQAGVLYAALHRAGEPTLLSPLAVVVLAAAVAVRQRLPVGALALLAAAFGLAPAADWVGWAALAPAAYVVGLLAASATRALWWWALGFAVLAPALTGLPRFEHAGAVVPFGAALCLAWALGRVLGRQQAYRDELESQRARLAAAELATARAAGVEERLRIARDLHDVLAHSMAVITVQASLGGLVIDADPARARSALGAVERTARESMAELRQMLDVLREAPTQQAIEPPVHGLQDLPDLCEQVGGAGVRVSLSSTGRPRTLSAGLALTVYRVVQEALTNVVKHAQVGSAEVRLAWTVDQLEVVVADRGAGQGAGTGHGLVGMRERVAAYGGELEAGPRTDGGFLVRARVPLVPPT